MSLSTPLLGHHSFAEFYLEEDTIEVEGEILEVQVQESPLVDSHPGTGRFRPPKVYAAEWASVSRLERDGISKRTLREGDWVRIWASPESQPERQPHPPQANRAARRPLDVGPEPLARRPDHEVRCPVRSG